MTMRREGGKALALRSPAAQWRHVGLDPGFVDEDEAARIDPGLMRLPTLTLAGDIRPGLLGWQHGFF